MSDSTEQRVNAIALFTSTTHAPFKLEAGWTDHTIDLGYATHTFFSHPDAEFKGLPALSIAFDDDECRIDNLEVSVQILAQNLRNGYSYKKINVIIYSFEIDSVGVIVPGTEWTMFKGLLYSVRAHFQRDYISIRARSDLYYTDKKAGLLCVEQCVVAFHGDAVCGVTVTSVPVTINTITGQTVGFTAKPAGVNFLYRSGFIRFEGLDIKVNEWNDSPGTSAVLAEPPPAAWLNKTVTIFQGCDKTYPTCRDIHNNTHNMLPLGISMVDYNTYVESR